MTPEETAAWQDALDLWRVQLRDPVIASGKAVGSFAWFGFPPQVNVDLTMLGGLGARDHLVSVFAHEIGHHVLSPSTRTMSLKLRHQMARTLEVCDPSRQVPVHATAALMSNLWSDLLINVRVARLQGPEPDMVALWRRLQADQAAGRKPIQTSWWIVMRAYELLWSLTPGTLCPATPPRAPAKSGTTPTVDADLLADTVRTFGTDPLAGALPFGMLYAPYLVGEAGEASRFTRRSTPGACAELPGGPATTGELAEVLADPRLHEVPRHPAAAAAGPAGELADEAVSSLGQAHGLALTLELYEGSDETATLAAWYENEARPWIRPLLEQRDATVSEDLPGPFDVWETGDDPDLIDWPATLRRGRVIPGVTTLRRTWHPGEPEPRREAVQLDLYIDSSGSMPRPQLTSPAVLAGTILAQSVLRGGGRVRVTSFSGPGQVAGGSVYTRDRIEVMRQLTTYFGGGTTFPLDLLARRYLEQPAQASRDDVRHHLVVLSDDGLVSMFGAGQEEYADVAAQVRRRVDTATLLLEDHHGQARDQAAAAGYDVLELAAMSDAPAACAALAARIAAYRPKEAIRAPKPA